MTTLPVSFARLRAVAVAAALLMPIALRAQHSEPAPAVTPSAVPRPAGVGDSMGVAATMIAEPTAAHDTQGHGAAADGKVDIITPHITDGNHLEIPYWKPPFYKEITLPHWAPVNFPLVGPVDISPTKHVVFMWLAAGLVMALLLWAAAASKKGHATVGHPKGFAAGIEAMALYLRSEVILPNVGHHGEKFVPFALTMFFFILFMNLLGLIPYGSTATGNISVTATLALIAFVVVEVSGMIAQGPGYLATLFYWNKDLPIVMRVIMFFVMSPVEIIGKFTKPFALAIRLFANMTAGHIVLLALIGLIFTFKSLVSGAPFLMAVAISMLELFVAFLQAFIFTLLTSVFIGQVREAHH
ncbi:MAG: F0F1 ATP synthase subunit A [Gemmatimonadaceae bacterium]|nr:F0F1 ATP synthase subunit A [Gemmatimonadaceae bacterium]